MELEPAERFKKNIPGLIDLLASELDIFRDKGIKVTSSELIKLVGGMLVGMDSRNLIEAFIRYSRPHWEKIRLKDEDFFINHASAIFCDLPITRIEEFKIIFTAKDEYGKPLADEEFKSYIWEYFSAMVRISIRYLWENNPDDSIKELAKKWKVAIKSKTS